MNISTEEEQAISERIVRDFGNGVFCKTGYLFDQIKGNLGRRVRLSEALHQITAQDVIVLLDRHPNNRTFAEQVMNYLGMSETWGFAVSTEQLQGILGFIECDLYVTTREGCLLIVGCHEDDLINNERTVWVPNSHLLQK